MIKLTLGLIVVLAALAFAGASVAGTHHRYVLRLSEGAYMTFDLPVEIQKRALETEGGRIVDRARGPQVCKRAQRLHDFHGREAYLNGKKAVVTINGTAPGLGILCTSMS